MKQLFWNKTCPVCNQGRLFLYRNLNDNSLYLHCEECERGFKDLNNVDKNSSFLTITEDFEAVEATFADIVSARLNPADFNKILE